MKTNLLSRISTFALAGLVVALVFGCSKNQVPQTEAPQKPAFASAEKTSFDEVTSQLDPGGNFYMYLGTAQWLENLSAKTEKWKESVSSMPGITDDQHEKINQAFNVLGHVIQDSGIQDLSGVGASSIEIEPGLYRDKAVLHHYPDKGSGFLWQIAGKSPHPLDGLDLLPKILPWPFLWMPMCHCSGPSYKRKPPTPAFPALRIDCNNFPAEFEEQDRYQMGPISQFARWRIRDCPHARPSNNVPVPYPPSNAMDDSRARPDARRQGQRRHHFQSH